MKKIFSLAIAFLFPVVAFADTLNLNGLFGPLTSIRTLINAAIPIIIGAAVLVFLWGVLRYVIAGDNPEERANARGFMIWGIVALFVMVSVWGLVKILQSSFGLEGGNNSLPSVPTV